MSERESGPEEAASGELGDWLRAQRERRKLSVDAVAEALHLDRQTIEALESERFEALGASVFVRGHVRTMAAFLGLDSDEALRRLQASAGETVSAEPELIVSYNQPLKRRTSVLPILLVLLVALVLAAIAAWWLWPTADRDEAGARDVAAAVTTLQPAVTTPPGTPSSAATTSTASIGAAATATEPAIRPAPSDTAVASAAAPATTPAASARRAVNEQPADGEAGVRFSFSETCWYEIRDANGARLAYGTADASTSRLIRGQRPLSVVIGVASAVEIRVDGEPFEIPAAARRGRSARFTIR